MCEFQQRSYEMVQMVHNPHVLLLDGSELELKQFIIIVYID